MNRYREAPIDVSQWPTRWNQRIAAVDHLELLRLAHRNQTVMVVPAREGTSTLSWMFGIQCPGRLGAIVGRAELRPLRQLDCLRKFMYRQRTSVRIACNRHWRRILHQFGAESEVDQDLTLAVLCRWGSKLHTDVCCSWPADGVGRVEMMKSRPVQCHCYWTTAAADGLVCRGQHSSTQHWNQLL